MKKKILQMTMALMFITVTLNAQKGSWYIGGQIGYNQKTEKNTNQKDIKTSTWNGAPEIGTFITNRWSIGLAVNLSGENVTDSLESETFKWAPVLYTRYFFKLNERFSTFVGLVGSYTTGSTKIKDVKYDLSGWGANFTIGAAYALSERFTAVGQYGFLGYTTSTTTQGSDKNTVENMGLNINSLGPVFNVGLYWTFRD